MLFLSRALVAVVSCCLFPVLSAKRSDTEIVYHGGEILTGNDLKVRLLFYGNGWHKSTEKIDVIDHFMKHISFTSFLDVLSDYKDMNNKTASRTFDYAGCTIINNDARDTFLEGASSYLEILKKSFQSGRVAYDNKTIYGIILDMDMRTCYLDNWCLYDDFCGFHSFFSSPYQVLYFVASDPYNSKIKCRFESTPVHNNGIDEMASVIMHEIMESIYDPYGTGYYANNKSWLEESEDYCSWLIYRTKDLGGRDYNIVVDDIPFLLFPVYNLTMQQCTDEFFDRDSKLSKETQRKLLNKMKQSGQSMPSVAKSGGLTLGITWASFTMVLLLCHSLFYFQ
jgi:hypothetical protein